MPHPKTIEAFKQAGVDYNMKGDREEIARCRAASSHDTHPQRLVTTMYRFRTEFDEQFLLYSQQITAKGNVSGNIVEWVEDKEETSLYYEPIVDKKVSYDQDTEMQTDERKQIRATRPRYLIPFNAEEAAKLKPFTNRATKMYVQEENGITRAVENFDDWVNLPFDVLLSGYIAQWKEEQEESSATASISQPPQTSPAERELNLKPKVSKS